MHMVDQSMEMLGLPAQRGEGVTDMMWIETEEMTDMMWIEKGQAGRGHLMHM